LKARFSPQNQRYNRGLKGIAMPIYEYRCTKCGHQDEVLQKVTEPPLTKCPACGKRALQKLMSAPGFHLKGSGWYATDFKNSGAKPAAKTAESSPKSGEASTSDAKPEAKPAAEPKSNGEKKAAPPAQG
jgi:putative FmdB family regulatory protein